MTKVEIKKKLAELVNGKCLNKYSETTMLIKKFKCIKVKSLSDDLIVTFESNEPHKRPRTVNINLLNIEGFMSEITKVKAKNVKDIRLDMTGHLIVDLTDVYVTQETGSVFEWTKSVSKYDYYFIHGDYA